MQWKLFLTFLGLFIISFLATTKADIISVNSGGSSQVITTPSQYIEEFFFTTNTSTSQAPSQSGSSGGASISPDLIAICDEAYAYLIEHPDNRTGINEYIEKINDNRTSHFVTNFQFTTLVDNWQSYCSDASRRSLREDFVCSQVAEFKSNKTYFEGVQISEFRESLNEKIPISPFLVDYYIRNYETICKKPIIKTVAKVAVFPLLLVFIFLIIIFNNRKKKLIIAKKPNPRLGNDLNTKEE